MVLSAALFITFASACGEPSTAADTSSELGIAVHALNASAESLERLVDESATGPRLSDELATVTRFVGLIAATARQAEQDAPESVKELSMRAGQLAPSLRRLARAVRDRVPNEGVREPLLTAVARMRVAARAVDLGAGDLYRSAFPNQALKFGELESRTWNGPLFPGSPIYVLDEGHIDAIDVAFEDGDFEISIHDETVVPDVERDPAHTIMVVKNEASLMLPEDPRFAFLGAPGATVWILPEAQIDAEALGVLWPGIATAEVEPGIFVDDEIQIRFKRVFAPDGFSLFSSPQDELTPPAILVDSEDGLPDTITQPAGLHQHMNWAFESAGLYLVRVDVRGRLSGVPGTPWVTSDTTNLLFAVEP